jgi:hypothetical protein
MKISLQELFPETISDEAAFHIAKFVHGLSLALESMYFDRMIAHSTSCTEEVTCQWRQSDAEENPF